MRLERYYLWYLFLLLPILFFVGLHVLFGREGPSVNVDTRIVNLSQHDLVVMMSWERSELPPQWLEMNPGSMLDLRIYEGENYDEFARRRFVFTMWKGRRDVAHRYLQIDDAAHVWTQLYFGEDLLYNEIRITDMDTGSR